MDGRNRQSRIERMKREKQRQERIRRQQIAIFKRCLVVSVVVVVILLLIVGVWALVKPKEQKPEAQKENLEAQVDNQAEEEANVISPDDEESPVVQAQEVSEQVANDGPAAQKPISKPEELKYAVPGWQVDTNGWWYANSDNTYYANGWVTLEGKKYFFDFAGYMQTGWAPIGGQGYFFNEAGQHVVDKKPNMIALTFDDGPGKHTERLLNILKDNNAKATFFMVGTSLENDYGYLASRMREDGHELGNHTYTHADLTELSAEEVQQEFSRVDDKLNEISPGAKTELARPPYGAKNEVVLGNIGRPAVFWNVDTNDWQTRDAAMIAEAVMSAKAGDIVLMHDIHEETVDACEIIIPQLIAAGYELVTVDELARANGIEMQDGKPYYGFTEANIANLNAPVVEEEGSEE